MLQRKNPRSLDKMYPSQPSSTSLSADKDRAIEPAVSDHEKCEKSESSLSSRFSKRLASIFLSVLPLTIQVSTEGVTTGFSRC